MKVHQIRVDFNVTEQIKRYVYVYLIEGKHCYLVDSGVAGCQNQIIERMNRIGRYLSELKGIFLTHAHPDHIGTAAWFRENTGCKIYASKGECAWIEDIDLQYVERPIPNFHNLAGSSVKVDEIVADGDSVKLDENFSIDVIGTAGHSVDEVSYRINDVVFIGDSIPVKGDIPIYLDYQASLQSLDKLGSMKDCQTFYPAWDMTYDRIDITDRINDAVELIELINTAVNEAKDLVKTKDLIKSKNLIKTKDSVIKNEELVAKVCEILHSPMYIGNPLFARTIQSHLTR